MKVIKKKKTSYNEALIHFLKRKVFWISDKGEITIRQEIKNNIDNFRENGKKTNVSILGKDGAWLSKELHKWKKKLYPEEKCSFNGTIQNLELLCELTNLTPNNLLLSYKEIIDKGGLEVEYLTKESIVEIAEKIKSNNNLLEDDLLLPVKSRPQQMVTLFIKFYRSQSYTKDVQVVFLISEYNVDEGIITYSNESDGSKIVNLSNPGKSRKTIDQMLIIAEDEFKLACDSFREDGVYDFKALQTLTSKREGDMLLDLFYDEAFNANCDGESVDVMIENATANKKSMLADDNNHI